MSLPWTDPSIARIVRIGLARDPNFPVLLVTYCSAVTIDNAVEQVRLPFSCVPIDTKKRHDAILWNAEQDSVDQRKLGNLNHTINVL